MDNFAFVLVYQHGDLSPILYRISVDFSTVDPMMLGNPIISHVFFSVTSLCSRLLLRKCFDGFLLDLTEWWIVLWDRNPGFLKSEIGPFSDFKRKSYLMDLKSAHSQESDFQESGEVDRFLKMGTHFQERSGSLENGLCVTWSGFWLRPWYLCGF